MLHIPHGTENNARQLLRRLGMGDYNATMAIQYMFIAPAATDPDMPPVILMTKHLQQGLRAAGGTCQVTGQIDDATAKCLVRLAGPDWHQKSWYELFSVVITAKRRRSLETPPAMAMGLVPDLSSFPDVPGGVFTLAAGGYAVWYFFFRKK
jgi:hypothetical protein